MNPLFKGLLAMKREGLAVNQALALLFIARQPVASRVCEVMRAIESNINVTSQLITRLHDLKLIFPIQSGRAIKWEVSAKGLELIKKINE